MTALAKIESTAVGHYEAVPVDDLMRIGKLFAESGFFNDSKQAAQAFTKIMAGREMGFEPFVSMANIHIVQSKPVLGATLIAAAIKKSGKYTFKTTKHDANVCEIEFFERENGAFVSLGFSSFSIDDAKLAGLTNKDNWRKHPQNMLFARAISNGAKWHCPDVFGGGIYVPDELEPEKQPETAPNAKSLKFNKPEHNAAFDAQKPVIDAEVVPDLPPMNETEIHQFERGSAILREMKKPDKTIDEYAARAANRRGEELREGLAAMETRLLEYKRKAVEAAVIGQSWDEDEALPFFEKFGVKDSWSNATDAQVEAIYDDLKNSQMIL